MADAGEYEIDENTAVKVLIDSKKNKCSTPKKQINQSNVLNQTEEDLDEVSDCEEVSDKTIIEVGQQASLTRTHSNEDDVKLTFSCIRCEDVDDEKMIQCDKRGTPLSPPIRFY